MDSFEGRIAVVTGGGSGMGRELVVQLAAQGCSVATCDVHEDALAETAELALKDAPDSVKVSTHTCDVSDEAQVNRVRDEVLAQHQTDHINLLFNNAGIGGGGSFLLSDREEWERTFAVDWGGVYNCTRAFLPLLVASDAGYLVNTSSVNGFWASLGPNIPHTAYSAAKFAVKGFTEALITDLRINAPHVKVAVVMPGHIGTNIVSNSRRIHGGSEPGDMSELELDVARAEMKRRGFVGEMTDEQVKQVVEMVAEMFRNNAPLSSAQAATIILDGVRAGKWRILVGDDAHALDENVRSNPENAYEADFLGLSRIFGG